VLGVNNMKTSLSGREPLNGVAEPRSDLVEADVFDVTESMGAKNCGDASGVGGEFSIALPTALK
jgi:hypothetical protein